MQLEVLKQNINARVLEISILAETMRFPENGIVDMRVIEKLEKRLTILEKNLMLFETELNNAGDITARIPSASVEARGIARQAQMKDSVFLRENNAFLRGISTEVAGVKSNEERQRRHAQNERAIFDAVKRLGLTAPEDGKDDTHEGAFLPEGLRK